MKHIINRGEKGRRIFTHYLGLMGIILGIILTFAWVILLGYWVMGLIGH